MAISTGKNKINFLSLLTNNTDLFVAVAAVGIVLMLIIPVPPFMLDILLLLNLAISFLIILSTLYVQKPIDFSSFPTLILLTTVYGLALNVSSTRLILTEGQAGNIISAFGQFVVRGNVVVGLIIFIVLLAIQFLVITKGASRVSEVSARFTLDSLPGKQLSINEDLNSGIINEKEAKWKREELNKEANFYGAMDGSSKFISGNVKVAVVVLLVDIIGGLLIGMVSRGESFDSAVNRYVLLTVGDGLVSQIPALLISVATGIIVTRNGDEGESFTADILTQLINIPKVLYITGITIMLMALLPGFPSFLNLLVGACILVLGYFIQNHHIAESKKEIENTAELANVGKKETNIKDVVLMDAMNLEIGYGLIPLVDESQNGDLLERIKLMREHIGVDIGILVPPIRIVDNVTIDSSEYVIKIQGIEITRGKVYLNRLLIMNTSSQNQINFQNLEGLEVKEPVFNLTAKWIKPEDRNKAENMGFEVFDSASVVATHLTETIKDNADKLLTRQDVHNMLNALKERYETIVEEALKSSNTGTIQKVLQNLLKERVKIRNMVPILETIADYGASIPNNNADILTEYVRQALSRQIVADYSSDHKSLQGILLDPNLEQILADSIHSTPQGYISSLDTSTSQMLVDETGKILEKTLSQGMQPVILCAQNVRQLVHGIISPSFPSIGVLSYGEIPNDYSLQRVGLISFGKES